LKHALLHERKKEAKMLVDMFYMTYPDIELKKKWNEIVVNGEHENEGGIVMYTARGLGIGN
tara:strand:- start:92 stop:274 length:183 start_codon:yes stop_codon:yes gene_type:complete